MITALTFHGWCSFLNINTSVSIDCKNLFLIYISSN